MTGDPYKPSLASVSSALCAMDKDGKMPPINGICLPGRVWLSINSVDFLDEIFVKSNAFNTKLISEQRIFAIIGERNVVFMDTFHKDYNATRKELSGAFFK